MYINIYAYMDCDSDVWNCNFIVIKVVKSKSFLSLMDSQASADFHFYSPRPDVQYAVVRPVHCLVYLFDLAQFSTTTRDTCRCPLVSKAEFYLRVSANIESATFCSLVQRCYRSDNFPPTALLLRVSVNYILQWLQYSTWYISAVSAESRCYELGTLYYCRPRI